MRQIFPRDKFVLQVEQLKSESQRQFPHAFGAVINSPHLAICCCARLTGRSSGESPSVAAKWLHKTAAAKWRSDGRFTAF